MRDNRSSQEQLVDPLGPSRTRKVPHTWARGDILQMRSQLSGTHFHGHPRSRDGSDGTSARSSHRSEDVPPRHGTETGPRAAGGQGGTTRRGGLPTSGCPAGAAPGPPLPPRTQCRDQPRRRLGRGEEREKKKKEKPQASDHRVHGPKQPSTGALAAGSRVRKQKKSAGRPAGAAPGPR